MPTTINGITVSRKGVFVPWRSAPKFLARAVLRVVRPERRFKSSSSQVFAQEDVMQEKMSPTISGALERAAIGCALTRATQGKCGVDMLLEALEDLGESPEGCEMLREMLRE